MDKIPDFLKRASDGLWHATKENGGIICKKHRVDHTGKIAYAVILNLELFDATEDIKYLNRAKIYAEFVFSKIKPDLSKKHWIVWPGNYSRYNMSNTSLDAGSAVDALVCLIENPKSKLRTETEEKYRNAVKKIASSYLIDAAVDKPITNQRLWASTGLSAAYGLFHEEIWKTAALKGISRALEEQWEDGFFSYHPFPAVSDMPEGSRDISPFYHSRHVGFILYSLDRLGVDYGNYKQSLEKGVYALIGLLGRDGLKSMKTEAKRWYWHSTYEVASYSFDLYALLKWSAYSGNALFASYARILWNRLQKEQSKNGWITAAENCAENFQCKNFWTCQTAWAARVWRMLPEKDSEWEQEYSYFSKADILRIGTPEYLITLRGKTFHPTLSWGSGYGGGGILYFGRKSNVFQNEYQERHGERESGKGEKGWLAKPKSSFQQRIKHAVRFIKKERHDFKSHIFYMFVELRAGNARAFWHLLFSHFLKRMFAAFSPALSTQWSAYVKSEVNFQEAFYKIVPSSRLGEQCDDFILERKYIFEEQKISVEDHVEIRRPLRSICFIDSNNKPRYFYSKKPGKIAIKYKL